jgi:hypothetical protein
MAETARKRRNITNILSEGGAGGKARMRAAGDKFTFDPPCPVQPDGEVADAAGG